MQPISQNLSASELLSDEQCSYSKQLGWASIDLFDFFFSFSK